MPKPEKPERLDRHSGTGTRGLSKKEGHKGWGKAGEEDGAAAIDDHDPNYVSDEDENVVLSRLDLYSPVEAVLTDFYTSGEESEAISSFKESVPLSSHPHFVKKLLIFAMERQAFEREHASRLLTALFNEKVLSQVDITAGVQAALDAIDDFTLDVRDGVDLLAKFIARAIVDEVVPPAFLKTASVEHSPKAKSTMALANGLFSERHGSERLAHIWGPGDLTSVKRLKAEVSTVIEEFLTNNDQKEAYNSVHNLNAPSFHPQLVKQAIRLSIEKTSQSAKISSLLKFFNEVGLISPDHFAKGAELVLAALDDLKLDVPNADKLLADVIKTAKSDKWLSEDFQKSA
jgi:hypothetical protein